MSSTLSTPVILNSCLLLSSAMPNTIIPPEVLAKELTVSQNDLGNFQNFRATYNIARAK